MAAILALTTTYTPAPSCTTDFYSNGAYYTIGGPQPTDCFPSGWASTSQYFSPGICPSGYTEACSQVVTSKKSTETQAQCCPSGWACYTSSLFDFPGPSQGCVSTFQDQVTTVVIDATVLTTVTATLHPLTEAVYGHAVSIRNEKSDRKTKTKKPKTEKPKTTKTEKPKTTKTKDKSKPTAAAAAATKGRKGRKLKLSKAAISGIAIGGAFALMALVFGAVLICSVARGGGDAFGGD